MIPSVKGGLLSQEVPFHRDRIVVNFQSSESTLSQESCATHTNGRSLTTIYNHRDGNPLFSSPSFPLMHLCKNGMPRRTKGRNASHGDQLKDPLRWGEEIDRPWWTFILNFIEEPSCFKKFTLEAGGEQVLKRSQLSPHAFKMGSFPILLTKYTMIIAVLTLKYVVGKFQLHLFEWISGIMKLNVDLKPTDMLRVILHLTPGVWVCQNSLGLLRGCHGWSQGKRGRRRRGLRYPRSAEQKFPQWKCRFSFQRYESPFQSSINWRPQLTQQYCLGQFES